VRNATREPLIATVGNAIALALNNLRDFDGNCWRDQRRQKFLNIGRKLG